RAGRLQDVDVARHDDDAGAREQAALLEAAAQREVRQHVHAERDLVPLSGAGVARGPDPGVLHQQIDGVAAGPRLDGTRPVADAVEVLEVHRNEIDGDLTGAVGAEPVANRRPLRRVAAWQDEPGAAARETSGDLETDAARGARHHGEAAVEARG